MQGLPFFVPADRPGAKFDIYGPVQPDGLGLEQAFEDFMRPPYFPVRFTDLRGDIRFHDVSDCDIVIGDAKVKVRTVPHVGITNGYRIEMGGAVVAYISDHQQPMDGGMDVPDHVVELCDGADLLIHDAQYTPEEFAEKRHWGHCTVEYAVEVAKQVVGEDVVPLPPRPVTRRRRRRRHARSCARRPQRVGLAGRDRGRRRRLGRLLGGRGLAGFAHYPPAR